MMFMTVLVVLSIGLFFGLLFLVFLYLYTTLVSEPVETENSIHASTTREENLLNVRQTHGVPLSSEELSDLQESCFSFTGYYNGHGQPVLKNVKTGENIAVCRMSSVQLTCDTYFNNDPLENKSNTSNPFSNT